MQAFQNWVPKSLKYETLKSGCPRPTINLLEAQKVGAQVHIIPHHPYLQIIFGLIQPPSCFEAGFTHSNAVMQVSADLGSFSPLPFPLLALKPCQSKYAFQCNIAHFCLGNRSSFNGFGLFRPPLPSPLWSQFANKGGRICKPYRLLCAIVIYEYACASPSNSAKICSTASAKEYTALWACLSSKTLYSAVHINWHNEHFKLLKNHAASLIIFLKNPTCRS